jgi:hypothetical protein
MAGAWNTISQTPNGNLGNTNWSSVWYDSGLIYTKGVAENDVNIFNIETNSWSTLFTIASTNTWSYDVIGWAVSCASQPIWVAGNNLYTFRALRDGSMTGMLTLLKYNKTTGVRVSEVSLGSTFGSIQGDPNWDGRGNWGSNKHKSVVKTSSGRIFIINWPLKQIWEFLSSTDTFVQLVGSAAWPFSLTTWLTCADSTSGPQACAYGDDIYMCGCNQPDSSATIKYLVSFNTNTNVFTNRVAMNVMFGANSSTWANPIDGVMFSLGNTIYWYGGTYYTSAVSSSNGPFTVTKLMAYSPASNTWSQISDLLTTPYIRSAVATNGSYAFLFGGTIGGSASQLTNKFTYILDTPTNFVGIYNPLTLTVDLTWTDNSNDETNYILERKRDDETNWTLIATLIPNSNSYSDNITDIVLHSYIYRISCIKVM